MTSESWVALLVFLLPLAYSPGPGNAFFAGIGATRGLRAAVPPLAGYHLATFVVTAALGLGLGVTLGDHPGALRILGLAGSCYVLWLAVVFLRSALTRQTAETTGTASATKVSFGSGVLVLVLNPKAYYIITAMFAQFLGAGGAGPGDVLAITTVFTLNNVVAFVVWTLAGSALTAVFRGDRARRWIDGFFALTLLGVALWMALPLVLPARP